MNNEERVKLADQAIEFVKPLLGVTEALSSDSILYFKGNERVATTERKNIILENLKIIRHNIDELEKLVLA